MVVIRGNGLPRVNSHKEGAWSPVPLGHCQELSIAHSTGTPSDHKRPMCHLNWRSQKHKHHREVNWFVTVRHYKLLFSSSTASIASINWVIGARLAKQGLFRINMFRTSIVGDTPQASANTPSLALVVIVLPAGGTVLILFFSVPLLQFCFYPQRLLNMGWQGVRQAPIRDRRATRVRLHSTSLFAKPRQT